MAGPTDDVAQALGDALGAWEGLTLTGGPAGGARTDARLAELGGERVVVRRSRRTQEQLDWQFDLQQHLRSEGVGIPTLVPTTDGRRHVGGVWVEAFVPGRPPVDDEDWERTAAAVARVHELTPDWSQRPGFLDAASLQTESRGGDVDLGAMPPEVASSLRGVWRALPPATSCVVHGDLSSADVLLDDEHVTLVDWDDARVDVPWFDLAALPRPTWPREGDARLVRAAGLAWEVATSWTSEPVYARERLLELRDEVSGADRDQVAVDQLHLEAMGRALGDD